jgi:cell division protein FtsI/penicillin-binding protein 2
MPQTSGRKRPPPRRPPQRRRPLVRRRRRTSGKRRLLALLILSVLGFLAISGRLIILQVFDAGSLDQAAARQRLTVIDLPATWPAASPRPGETSSSG